MFSVLVAAVLCGAAFASERSGAAEKEDKDFIQGTWRMIEWQRPGQETLHAGPTVYFEGNHLYFLRKNEFTKDMDRVNLTEFHLDPGKTPKQIDLVQLDGPNKGKTFKGIYELTGDQLRVCVNDEDHLASERPTEFKTDGGRAVVVREREK